MRKVKNSLRLTFKYIYFGIFSLLQRVEYCGNVGKALEGAFNGNL